MKTRDKKFGKNNAKGYTLVELVVVIAVSSIFLLMVTTIMITAFKTYGKSKEQFSNYNEVVMVDNYFDIFFTKANEVGANIKKETSNSLKFLRDDKEYSITWNETSLTYFNGENDIEYHFKDTLFEVELIENMVNLKFYNFKDEEKNYTRNYLYRAIGGITTNEN